VNVEFQCQNCSTTLRVDRQYLGRQARCPNCKTINQVADQKSSDDASSSVIGQEVPDQQVQTETVEGETDPLSFDRPSQNTASEKTPAGEAGNQGFRSNPYTSPRSRSTAWHGNNPHRGGLILTLGILAATCNFLLIPGIMAWVMGASDLKKMKAGYMDSDGQGITTAGMVLGIIFTLLILVPIALYLFFAMFLIAVAIVAG